MIKIKFQILGKEWLIQLLSARKFLKRNGKNCFAATWSDRVIDLSPKGTDIETIRHELVHAYQKEMCLGSMNEITAADMEEWIAEFIGRRGPELIKLADELHTQVMKATMKVKVKASNVT